jgi:hypothetical protein
VWTKPLVDQIPKTRKKKVSCIKAKSDEVRISVLRISGLRESRGRVAHQRNSRNHEERKAEVSGEKCLVFDVSGFGGRRGKTFDIRIREIANPVSRKEKGKVPMSVGC